MSLLASILASIAGPLAQLIENALSDSYDKEKELEALLRIGRAVSDARVAHLLHKQ